ncbi:hypothetical protein BD413DRAFT_195882 [Trametes elegans]|nr:hypothetical protein BD413DRAFT_195882 [Trametes elegans]
MTHFASSAPLFACVLTIVPFSSFILLRIWMELITSVLKLIGCCAAMYRSPLVAVLCQSDVFLVASVSVGRPVWECESDEQLVSPFISAIEAHDFLLNQGISHCKITAHDILLSDDPAQGVAGFLSDLKFAHVEDGYFENRTTETVHSPTGAGRNSVELHQ